ncbi:MAG: hypothetical protein ABJG47_18980 [Ekhidna sp.]
MIKQLAILSLLLFIIGCSQSDKEQSQKVRDNSYRPSGFHAFINHGKDNTPVSLVQIDTSFHLFYTTGVNEWGHLVSSNLVDWAPSTSFPLNHSGHGEVIWDENNLTGLNAPWNILISDGDELNLSYSADGLEWTTYDNNPVLKTEGTISSSWNSALEQWILTIVDDSELSFFTSENLTNWSKGSTVQLDTEVSKAVLINKSPNWILLTQGESIAYQTGSFDGQMFVSQNNQTGNLGISASGFTVSNSETESLLVLGSKVGSQFPTFTTPLSINLIKDKLTLFPASHIQNEIVGKRRAKLSKLYSDGPSWFKIAIDQEFEELEIVVSDDSSDLRMSWNKSSNELTLSGTAFAKENASNPLMLPDIALSNLQIDLLIDHTTIDLFINNGTYATSIFIQPNTFLSKVEVFLDGEKYDAKGVLYDIGI